MPYILESFNGVVLPSAMPGDGMGVTRESNVITLPGGGTFDADGAERLYPRALDLQKRGTLWATDPSSLKGIFNALRAQVGQRGVLWRQWDDSGKREWVTARLVALNAMREIGHKNTLPVEFGLVQLSETWGDETEISLSPSISSAPQTVTATNGGNAQVKNVTFTVTAGGSSITSVTIEISGVSEIEYTGTINAGEALVIDCGARSVENNGSGDYDNFALTSNHVIDDWIRLEPGDNSVIVTLAPGGALPVTMGMDYYNAWL